MTSVRSRPHEPPDPFRPRCPLSGFVPEAALTSLSLRPPLSLSELRALDRPRGLALVRASLVLCLCLT